MIRTPVAWGGPKRAVRGSYGVSEQPDIEPSNTTAEQINDLFYAVELTKAINTEEFRNFLDHVPIAIVVSKLFRGDQRHLLFKQSIRNPHRADQLRLHRPVLVDFGQLHQRQ
jgi:hypothetical protein